MQYVIIILCVLAVCFAFLKERNLYNPVLVICFMFGTMVFLSNLRLNGLFEVSQFTYFIIFIGLVSILIGITFINILRPKSGLNKEALIVSNLLERYKLNYLLISVVYIIVILFLSFQTISSMRLLFQGYSLSEVRSTSLDLIVFPHWYLLTDLYIISPLVFALIPLGIISFFYGKRIFIIPTLLIVIFSAIGSGGRFIVYYLVIQFIIAALLFKKRIDIRKVPKKRIILIVLVGISLIFYISSMRGITSLFDSIYVYIAGAIPHLDYRINVIQETGNYTYGIASIRGFLTPILFILNQLNIIGYPEIYNKAMELSNVEDFIFIGENQLINAFVTPFFYFYLDGGLAGVIIFSIIYGFIFGLTYDFVKRKANLYNVAAYLLFIQGVSTSMVRWQFVIIAYALSFVYIRFLLKKQIKKN